MLLAQTALDHLPLRNRPVRPVTDGATEPLVPLLVTRIAHRVMLVPSTGRTRSRRPRTTVHAHATTTTLPADLGHGHHHGTYTLRVIDLVAVLTGHRPGIRGRGHRVTATDMALSTPTALPPGTHPRGLGEANAGAVVVIPALAAHRQVGDLSGVVARATFNVLRVRTGVGHFVDVVPAEAREGLHLLEATRGRHTGEVKGVRACHLAGDTRSVPIAEAALAAQAVRDGGLEAGKRTVRVACDVTRPIGAGPVHVEVVVLVEETLEGQSCFLVANLLKLVDVLGSDGETPGRIEDVEWVVVYSDSLKWSCSRRWIDKRPKWALIDNRTHLNLLPFFCRLWDSTTAESESSKDELGVSRGLPGPPSTCIRSGTSMGSSLTRILSILPWPS